MKNNATKLDANLLKAEIHFERACPRACAQDLRALVAARLQIAVADLLALRASTRATRAAKGVTGSSSR